MTESPAPLMLEYVFEGAQRGYNFTTPTRAYSEDVLKHIWRVAMPRGQGWGNYTDAQSLKVFRLPDGRMVVSRVTVTDQADESGRRGIRRAAIQVMPRATYPAHLAAILASIPASIQADAEYNRQTWHKIGLMRQLQRKTTLIFSHHYTTPVDWQVVEAVLLQLALIDQVPLLQQGFTTLALTTEEEAAAVALPADKIAQLPRKIDAISIV